MAYIFCTLLVCKNTEMSDFCVMSPLLISWSTFVGHLSPKLFGWSLAGSDISTRFDCSGSNTYLVITYDHKLDGG